MIKTIPFSSVKTRKLKLEASNGARRNPNVTYESVSNKLNAKNLQLFIEQGRESSFDEHCKLSMILYDRLMQDFVSDVDKAIIHRDMLDSLAYVANLDTMHDYIDKSKNIDSDAKELFHATLDNSDNCDRILRNEDKINKRFNTSKIIKENIYRGCRHTVFELCSLIDTYNISDKAKFNIALENVSYELLSSGFDVKLEDIVESVVEYFMTREAVITDKKFNDYLNVLENNKFIDHTIPNISYLKESVSKYGSSHCDKLFELQSQLDNKNYVPHIESVLSIKTEKKANGYINNTIKYLLDENTSVNDANVLLKSIYLIPLIGNINEQFINTKIGLHENKLDIRKKLVGTNNDDIIREVLNDGDLYTMCEYVSDGIHFDKYILDENYVEETDPIKLLESGSEDIKGILNTFKASKEKSPSKFKAMINRIMVKSPENIIDETPNVFAAARGMVYLSMSVALPLGPVFAGITALITKLVTTHLNMKQAKKLLSHLRNEKEKAEKKLEKLSGDDKNKQEDYIKCIDDNISKVKKFISNIDEDDDELIDARDASGDDDFDFGDFDDFDDFEDFDESANIVLGLLEFNDLMSDNKDFLDKLFEKPLDSSIVMNLSVFADNCENNICEAFYDKVKECKNKDYVKYDIHESNAFANILSNKGSNEITDVSNDISYIIQCEAMNNMINIVNEGVNLNTLKMAVINFKKKFRDLKGKEQELWRNIDIATVNLSKGIQKALTSDRREAIIKGSIIPSFSKCIKSAIAVGAVGAFTGPVGAAITALGMFAASKHLNNRERKLIYDEINTELQVVEKQIQMAENEGNMNQYRFLLNYQKKLTREKHRIKYGIHMSGRTIPEIKGGND